MKTIRIYPGPGAVRRMVFAGWHQGDVILAHPRDHARIRLLRDWDASRASREPVDYVLATCYLLDPTERSPLLVDGYVPPHVWVNMNRTCEVPYLARVQMTAELLLSS